MANDSGGQPRELELKFNLSAGSIAVLEKHPALQAAAETRHEVTTYFDTPHQHLNQMGASLRVRRVGKRRVQTLKLRSNQDAFGRGEWEWPVRGDTPELDRLAETPVASMLGSSPALQSVFVTDIQRTVRPVRRDEAMIEVALDVGSVQAGKVEERICELEFELKEGSDAAVYRVAATVHARVPMTICTESKADRGWRLLTGRSREAVKYTDVHLPDDVTAAEAFRKIVDGVLAHLMANCPAAASGDIEGVHQVRVAIRRLRAVLILYQPLLEPHVAATFTEALRSLGRIFGGARDWDVFSSEILASAQEHGLATIWLDLLREPAEALRVAAHEHARAEMEAPGLTATVLGLGEWVDLADETTSRPLRVLAPDLLKRLEQKVEHRGRLIAQRSDSELHALRKATKKLRYSIEFVAPLLLHQNQVKKYLHRCNKLLKRLGSLNDAAVAVTLAEQLGGERRPELAPAVAALARWASDQQEVARQHLLKDWRAFRAAPMPV